MDNIQKLTAEREIIAEKIKVLQKERKRLNNAISQAKHQKNKKKV